ncbi:MAG: hypothetical protein CVV64_13100 [Candidatus Wallbacteria bacterium HGW-Wallbacteria-1]|jgi:hypothetical protein|uniref:Glycosyltransferase RgtA/B/C/D-like domain-containing protein n=1 Tax=Candidatus Wallbacteria bacterium HGW-Wallbacteria-1 TaxID=2013854 RepID=A0A2N1PN22_9BACT|nr:MAG: hypothetical protein CVV64_13100 [Candidatus Wallbacteria bacterium HGW-Wallbacteria-1]
MKKNGNLTFFLLILCLMISGFLQYWEYSTRQVILNDGATYIRDGELFARGCVRSTELIGGTSVVSFGVGYPLLIALFGKVIGNFESGAHLVAAFSALFIVIAAFFTIRKLIGVEAALLASAMFAFNSYTTLHGALASRMLPFFLCAIFQIYYSLLVLESGNGRDLFFLAFWSGLSYSIRLEGIFIFAISLAVILLSGFSKLVFKRKSACSEAESHKIELFALSRTIIVSILLFFLFSSPYIAMRIYAGENPLIECSATGKMNSVQAASDVTTMIKSRILHYGKQFFYNFTGKFHDRILPRLFPAAVIFLSGAGFVLLLSKRASIPMYFSIVFILTTVCFCFLEIFEYEKRYFAFLIYPAYFLSSYALIEIREIVKRKNAFLGNLVLIVLFLAVIGPEIKQTAQNCLVENKNQTIVLKSAGEWLAKEHSPDTVSAFFSLPAYYSGARKWTGNPIGSLDDVADRLRVQGCKFVIIDSIGAKQKNKDLLTLAFGREDAPGLELLKSFQEQIGDENFQASVYRVR